MERLDIDFSGVFTLRGRVVAARQVEKPELISEDEIKRLEEIDGIFSSGANAFVLGEERVTKEVDGDYDIWSSSLRRDVRMEGPRLIDYFTIVYYRIDLRRNTTTACCGVKENL